MSETSEQNRAEHYYCQNECRKGKRDNYKITRGMLTVHVLVVVWTVETINSRDVNIIVCSGTIIEALLHSYLF